MKREEKLNCILLIDDDEPTNYLNKLVIDQLDCTNKIIIKQTASAALDYLQEINDHNQKPPNLIFLDINMPAMDGWEFLEHYEQLQNIKKHQVRIIMLSTSENPDDKQKAKNFKAIDAFKNKPLTIDILQEIINKYFAFLNIASNHSKN